MTNLENICAWKEATEAQSLIEGNLGECNKCDGYNESCFCYYSNKETQTKYNGLK